MLWKNEPNKLEWEHDGMKCLIIRHPSLLHLCGYVCLPESHPHYGKDYDDIPVDVHWGLTFSSNKDGDDKWPKGYWVGFDCAHLGDLSPGMNIHFSQEGVYRDINYVKRETNQLAEQLSIRGEKEES